MSRHIDKEALVAAVKASQSLSDEQKADIIELIRTKKKYGLVWEDSPELAEQEMKTKLPILREVAERRILNDTEAEHYPNHVLIEGENLQALIALTYTHAGMIDVIYIDPPYNTGNKDFVYNDSFIGEDDEYRHSKWLSFMERRLKIAKTLLSDKGVIFISIDDNEQANLKLLCDEVFGQNAFVATIPWRKRTAKSDVPHGLSQDYEWVLCYAKDGFTVGIEKETRKYYETPDFPNRPWRVHDLTKQTSAEERPNSFFTITNPKTGEEYPANPNRTWAITQETFQEYYRVDRIVFPGEYDFLRISKPVLRYWKSDDEKKAGDFFGFTSVSTNLPNEVGMTQDGTKDIDAVFGSKVFGFPKPLSLIKYLLKISTPRAKNIVVLDFFAGSGTTLHATMQLNAEDGGHRQCILVTNNENGICENVTYERNKRVIQGYTTPKGDQVAGLTKNNLRYYKVKAVPRDNSIRSRMKLAAGSLDMLCIMEDLYQEKDVFGTMALNQKQCRYFEEDERSMLVLLNTDLIPKVVEQLKEMQPATPIHIYINAPGDYAFDDEFEEVASKVELYPLPQPILNAYRQWLPKQDEVLLDVPDDYELTEAELNESGEDFISKED